MSAAITNLFMFILFASVECRTTIDIGTDPLSCEPKIWQDDGYEGQIYTDNPNYKGETLCNQNSFKREADSDAQLKWDLWDQCLTQGMVLSEIDNECHHLATR